MGSDRRREELVSARKAAGLTQENLAEVMSVDRSTVIRWEAGDHAPLPYQWPKLAKALGRTADELRGLIGLRLLADTPELDSSLEPAFGWLDRRAGWSAGTARARVASAEPARPQSETSAGRSRVAAVLAEYYNEPVPGHSAYAARCGQVEVATSILTQPGWLDLACPLTAKNDRLVLSASDEAARELVDECAAVRRLAAAAAEDVRIADVPLYRLTDVQIRPDGIAGRVQLVPFVEYALSMDLLERELRESRAVQPGRMPLRDRYLPDLHSVLDLAGRLCAGGVLALTAIARPADPFRGEADYLMLVQERSQHVVNATRRLAVIPKSFHGPLANQRADARIGATLRRELEEELFGRGDVDRTTGVQRAADPMHPARLSGPMRWLTEQPGRLRMECTGFGLNLVSGNYEFASLVVIDDEEFWPRFGGDVEANWEAAGLRQYSTLDGDLITELISDETWSNEGLFAFLQGLRRLAEIGGERVRIPAVELGS
ncbi:helix-turn-helix domain-containing protein [Amycolatopsis benzoatilytica]|uniref:helix-turn-helix domain-containing protein n=1 Tax=Amycolatopsis benzoatilytica TaxID=346045 RepID=UPI0003A916AD|nr:helix-turn-helix domain-containing protein [Amycolatopsis benzoatilytica]